MIIPKETQKMPITHLKRKYFQKDRKHNNIKARQTFINQIIQIKQ